VRRQLARVALGLALGFLIAAALPGGRRAAPPDWPQLAALGPGALQDESAGRLSELVVHYTPEMGGELAAVYSELFAALEPDTIVRVVAADRAALDDLDRRLARAGRPVRARLVPEPVGHAVSGWAKDRFLAWVPARRGAFERALLVPPKPVAATAGRLGDWPVPAELATRSGGRWRSLVLPLDFDGGDFAAAGDAALAGWTLMTKNPELAAAGPEGARARLAALAGRPVVLLGSRPGEVPEHHVNMYALPVGGRRALVGDVRLAARCVSSEELAAQGIGGDFTAECALRFDCAAAELEAEGFAVTRVPVVPLAGGAAYGPYVTYTNAFIETFRDGRRAVYMPKYGIAGLDQAAEDAWRRLGFEVRAVNVAPVWRGGGTLDCLVGVLARKR
jgi:hypothetical protein